MKKSTQKSLKEEMEIAETDYRKKVTRYLRRKYPDIAEEVRQEFINKAVPLIIKAIYKADTRAFVKIMNMAFGKPK